MNIEQPSQAERRPLVLFLSLIAICVIFLTMFTSFAAGERKFLRELDKKLAAAQVQEARKSIEDRHEFTRNAVIASFPLAIGIFVVIPLLAIRASAKKKKKEIGEV